MKESLNIPYLDKAVGEKTEHQLDFEKWLTERFLQKSEKIENLELDKTARDVEVINFVDNSVSFYLSEYGREKNIIIPLDKIHLLIEGGVEKYTEGRQREAAASSVIGVLIIDRPISDAEFAIKIFHELTHLKSYKALQVATEDRKLRPYRNGFSVTTRDGKTRYFEDFEEAIVSILTERFYEEKIITNPIFQDEISKQKKAPQISRQEEVERLNEMVDELWEGNKEKFNTRNEILELFINAQVNGRLLPVARLVENTFGKGSFRQLGISKNNG